MLNQSFAVDNFQNIYDIENRKKSITEYLGPEYKDYLAQIKYLQSEIKRIKRIKLIDRTENEKQKIIDIKQEIEEITAKKKEIQHKELEIISKKVNNKKFRFDLQSKPNEIFVIQNTKEAFFAIKQLQYNIRKTFKVKQNSRHLILSQIKLLLNDSSPKYLIRTDVSKFFESIPQDKLFKKIKDNTLLNKQSKIFISQILEDFNNKKDTTKIDINKGVPRGVGVSSYLSELYMKDIDNQISNIQDVIYYARYVDDFFILISPNLPKKSITDYYEEIKSIIQVDNLTLHTSGEKCNLIDLSEKIEKNTHYKFTYLGYNIHVEQKPCDKNRTIIETTFGLSQNKKDKIETRVLKSIEYFNNKSKYDLKVARKNLLLCLSFLTTNTKLSGAKNRVKVGIYYSNYLLDDCFVKEINTLDNKLKGNWLSKIRLNENLFENSQKKIEYINSLKLCITTRCSFYKGFDEKKYHIFSKNDLKTIKQILE